MTDLEFLHGALANAESVSPVFFMRDLTGWRDTDDTGDTAVDATARTGFDHPATVVRPYTAVADGTRMRDLAAFEALVIEVLGAACRSTCAREMHEASLEIARILFDTAPTSTQAHPRPRRIAGQSKSRSGGGRCVQARL